MIKIKDVAYSSNTQLVISLSVLLTFLFLSFYYIWDVGLGRINSDGATYYVLALEMLEAKSVFPPGWAYVNGDLMSFGKPGVIALMHLIGIDGYLSYQLASAALLIFSAVIIYSTMREIGIVVPFAILAASIPMIPFSDAFMFHANDIGSYLVRFIHISLLLFLIIKLTSRKLKDGVFYVLLGAFTVLLFIIFSENPRRYVVYFLVPAMGAIVYYVAVTKLSATNQLSQVHMTVAWGAFPRIWLVLVLGFLSIFGSLFFYKKLEIINVDWASAATLSPLSELPERIANTLYGLGYLSGVNWAVGEKIASASGVTSIIKLLTYPLALFAPIQYTFKSMRALEFPQAFYCLVAVIGFGITVLLLSATSLQVGPLVESERYIRYVFPFFIMVLVCNFLLWKYYSILLKGILLLAFVVASISAVQSSLNWSSDSSFESRLLFVKKLEEKGVSVAYAPYWHSHIYTLLSKGSIQFRPISLAGTIQPFPGFTSKQWYANVDTDATIAMIVPLGMETKLLSALESSCYQLPSEKYSIAEYEVFLFHKDPTTDLFGRHIPKVCIGANSRHTVGKYDAISRALKTDSIDGRGFLHYGPYVDLACGRYVAKFDVSNEMANLPSDLEIGFVDVVAGLGKNILGHSAIGANSGVIEVAFEASKGSMEGMEFRVFSAGVAEMQLNSISIESEGLCSD